MHRRDLLRWAALTGVLPAWSGWASVDEHPAVAMHDSKSLVLVELKGGNDGLNTLVPYRDEEYFRLRPQLAIGRDDVLSLNDGLGLHPALRPLLRTWEAGELAWVQSVGYAQPNRSHFRSIDIWETGSDGVEVSDAGWLASGLPARAAGGFPDVVVLGGDEGPARGGTLEVISLRTPQQFAQDAAQMRKALDPEEPKEALAHLLRVRAAVRRAGAEFQESITRLQEPPVTFPKTAAGRQLQEVARMLIAGMEIPAFKVSIGSFDTHRDQLPRHRQLLGELADALAAFRESLKQASIWDRVLVMSYSEFGRRVAENASLGTDHGTAAPHFVMGGRVKGGLYGESPDLSALEDGDLVYTTDYRRLYTTIAQRWWGRADVPWQERFPAMDWV